MPYVDRTVFTTNDQSSGEVADPNKLEANDSHIADVVDANYTELNDFVNGEKISGLRIINVIDCGAKGDGITDDTQAIQNAINDAENEGKTVFIPQTLNFYKITSSLQFKRNTRIASNKAILEYEGTSILLKVEGSSSSHIYPMVEGLVLRKKDEDKVGIGMSVKYSRMGGIFADCEFKGFEHGVIHSDDTTNQGWSWLNSFTNCKFRYNKFGVTCLDESNGVTFDKCLFNNNEDYGFKVKNSNMLNLINSEFETNGVKSGGHAIVVDETVNFKLSGCYLEDNGYNDTDSAVIHIGGSGTSLMPIIENNYIHAGSAHTSIKAVECFDVRIIGNEFYESNPPSAYDIDIGQISSTSHTFIMGNRSSSSTGKLNVGSVSNNAWIQHGNEFYKNTLKLSGDYSEITLSDETNNSSHGLQIVNNKMRVKDELGDTYFLFNGDTGQIEGSIHSGPSSSRPSSPTTGYMYYDTDLIKPIWYYSGVWKDAMGTTV